MFIRTRRALLGAALGTAFGIVLAGPAAAVDGVIEINQVRANAGFVTPTDEPGLPVTIGESGSYRLTGNLVITDADTTAIEITAPDVTLDLNGHAITGFTSCTNGECSGTGTGNGVTAQAVNVAIHDGSIRGMGSAGIDVESPDGKMARIEEIRAHSNGRVGISASSDSAVADCSAYNNGSSGISAGSGSVVTNNVANFNGFNGIQCLEPHLPCVIIGNHARGNAVHGFNAGSGSTLVNNSATDNGSEGFRLGSGAGYTDNVLEGNNDGGDQVLGGEQIGPALCDGEQAC